MTEDAMVSLVECPIGLFFYEHEHGRVLCLKTEYGNNKGRIDAYIVASGEFFWGAAPQTIASQRAQMVRPVPLAAVEAALAARPQPEGMETTAESRSLLHEWATNRNTNDAYEALIFKVLRDIARLTAEIASLKAKFAEAEADKAARSGEAAIEAGSIVISVPISEVPAAFDAWPGAPRNDNGDPLYRVTDAATFAKGIVRYLNDESEDGTTRIHLMLDSAMNEALEQGEEGVEEIATIRARGGST